MTQITSGLRSVLSWPQFYDLFQNAVGANKCRHEFVQTYVRARPGDSILDIGCGTAQILKWLPTVEYYGFDSSKAYVRAAQNRYASRGHFSCEIVEHKDLTGLPRFDIVLAIGVLHHLADCEAVALFSLARAALKAGGRLVTLDGCYDNKQSRVAKILVSMDRGQNIRDKQGYETLARPIFADVKSHIRHDLARLPYTHLILECTA
jgi:cyclopropane fatty-acyl-phospholipid synthase-like methyltransferase